jgi:hypothetical protein
MDISTGRAVRWLSTVGSDVPSFSLSVLTGSNSNRWKYRQNGRKNAHFVIDFTLEICYDTQACANEEENDP